VRTASLTRNTAETKITMTLELDRSFDGKLIGSSGIGFFDHMLNSFCVHGGFIIKLDCEGDLYVDSHHTVEDVGIVLGKLFAEILGNRSGIKRFGESHIPMDEAFAFSVIDISGRPYLVFDAQFNSPMLGQFDTELAVEFFRAFAYNMGATLHMKLLYGSNDHHKIEALFKSAAKAVGAAVTVTEGGILSAKGVL